jgi:hypothetical protein
VVLGANDIDPADILEATNDFAAEFLARTPAEQSIVEDAALIRCVRARLQPVLGAIAFGRNVSLAQREQAMALEARLDRRWERSLSLLSSLPLQPRVLGRVGPEIVSAETVRRSADEPAIRQPLGSVIKISNERTPEVSQNKALAAILGPGGTRESEASQQLHYKIA